MARVGPDTSNALKIWIPFNHFGGYYYDDHYITTFSHLHMVGSGVVDYGWLGLFPVALQKDADIIKTLSKMVNSTYGYRSKFSH